MLRQETILVALNKLFNQTAKIRKGTDAVYYCPHCKHYKRKLEVSLTTGKYNCWVCNFRGLSFRSLFKKMQASSEYYAILGEVEQMRSDGSEWKINFDELQEVTAINRLPDEFKPLAIPSNTRHYKMALNYVLARNITKYDILRYNIGYCDTGYYQHRIIIPSYDLDGKLNFFSARDYLGLSGHKYKLCNFSKNIIGNELLINFDEPITLVEGQFDAISVRRNVIPLFGKNMSKKLKARLLESDVPRVNVLLDNDAYADTVKLCEYLVRNHIPTAWVKLEEKDPSLLGFDKTWEIINKSTIIEFDNLIKMKLI